MGHLYQLAGFSGNTIDPVVDHSQGSEHWYRKYSTIIYGIILQLAGNKTRAGRILKEVFFELTRKHEAREGNKPLPCNLIFKQIHNYTVQYLHQRGLKPVSTKPFGENFPLLQLLYFDYNTIDDVAIRLNQPKQDILQGLRHEFKLFRNLNLAQPV